MPLPGRPPSCEGGGSSSEGGGSEGRRSEGGSSESGGRRGGLGAAEGAAAEAAAAEGAAAASSAAVSAVGLAVTAPSRAWGAGGPLAVGAVYEQVAALFHARTGVLRQRPFDEAKWAPCFAPFGPSLPYVLTEAMSARALAHTRGNASAAAEEGRATTIVEAPAAGGACAGGVSVPSSLPAAELEEARGAAGMRSKA
jgi:hypothetical protein